MMVRLLRDSGRGKEDRRSETEGERRSGKHNGIDIERERERESEWKRPVEGQEVGSVECCDRSGVSESVELERGWSVGGLHRHFPVADLDAHRLGRVENARMFQKTGWSERWCSRIVHTARTLGRIAMPRSHRQSEMERTIEVCFGCGKMDCGRAGWSVDFHFSPFATQRKEMV